MDEQKERQRDEEVAETSERQREDDRRMEERASESRNRADTLDNGLAPLFNGEAADKFRARWLAIQSKFVDDPKDSVRQADDLVADVIENITRSFADRRGTMEKEWTGGGNASTEDLRIALKQYRSFFERLLSLQS